MPSYQKIQLQIIENCQNFAKSMCNFIKVNSLPADGLAQYKVTTSAGTMMTKFGFGINYDFKC